ncbi:MAG: heme o synthase [Bacteroidia bacterium]
MEPSPQDIKQEPADYTKFQAFIKLTKYSLAGLVVFSAVITYITVAPEIKLMQVLALSIGGFMITAAANGFNQIIEKDLDKFMDRTKNRPMPTNKLSSTEAFLFCALFGIGGTVMLWVYTNPLSGILGFISILLYALVYTPLKRVTPFSVFVGAFPGALPTLIGAVSATDGFGSVPFFGWILFIIQFFWQFPHFWSLAWMYHDDYQKAGFFMLPSSGGRDDQSKFQILLYSLFMIPISLLPFVFNYVGWLTALIVFICSITLSLQAYNFFRIPTIEHAKKLFIVAIIYLPVVQLALMTKA